MIVLIDNYDSFVDNIARYFRRLQLETRVVRNDRVTPDLISELQPKAIIVITPVPARPRKLAIRNR